MALHFSAISQCTLSKDNFELVFFDEFNYTSINTLWTKWKEVDTYGFNDVANIDLDGNNLILKTNKVPVYTANNELPTQCNSKGMQLIANDDDNYWHFHFGNKFSTGPMTSNCYDNDIEAGYFEVRCKMPYFPIDNKQNAAFWLFGWSAEFDVFEYSYNNEVTNNFHAYGLPVKAACQNLYRNIKNKDLSKEYHKYSCLWEVIKNSPLNESKYKVTYFMDDKELRTITFIPNHEIKVGNYFLNSASPFVDLRLSFAPILKSDGSSSITNTFINNNSDAFIIDYVRIYRKKSNVFGTKAGLNFELNQSDGYSPLISNRTLAVGVDNRLFFRDIDNFIIPMIWGNGNDNSKYYKQTISVDHSSARVGGDIEVNQYSPFFVRDDGTIGYLHWDETSKTYFHMNLNGFTYNNVSKEKGCFKVTTDGMKIYYKSSTDNRLWEISYNIGSSLWFTQSVANEVSGSISIGEKVSEKYEVYFRGTDNKLKMWYNGTVSFVDPLGSSAPMDRNVKGDVHYGANRQIFYHGGDDKVHAYQWNGNNWAHITILSSAPFVGGRLKVLKSSYSSIDIQGTSGSYTLNKKRLENIIYYSGVDQKLNCLYFDNGQWNHSNSFSNCSGCIVNDDFVVTSNNQIIYSSSNSIKTDFCSVFGCEILNPECTWSTLDLYYNNSASFWTSSNTPFSNFNSNNTIESYPENNIEVYIYPNSFKDELIIQTLIKQDLVVSIFNLYGNKVLIKNFINSTKAEMNTSDLKSGIYFIQVTSKDGKFLSRQKIIKN